MSVRFQVAGRLQRRVRDPEVAELLQGAEAHEDEEESLLLRRETPCHTQRGGKHDDALGASCQQREAGFRAQQPELIRQQWVILAPGELRRLYRDGMAVHTVNRQLHRYRSTRVCDLMTSKMSGTAP